MDMTLNLIEECLSAIAEGMGIEQNGPRQQCLDLASQCVNGQRAQDYGKVENNFETIARLIEPIVGVKVEPWKVALILDAVKTARILSNPQHADSWVDKAGYAACGYEVSSAGEDHPCKKA